MLCNLVGAWENNWFINYPCQKLPFSRSAQENRSQALFSFVEFREYSLLLQWYFHIILAHDQQYFFFFQENVTLERSLVRLLKGLRKDY